MIPIQRHYLIISFWWENETLLFVNRQTVFFKEKSVIFMIGKNYRLSKNTILLQKLYLLSFLGDPKVVKKH